MSRKKLCYGAKLGAAIYLIKCAKHESELRKSLTNLYGYIGLEEIKTIKENMHDSWHGLGITTKADKIVSWFDNIEFTTMLTDREEYRKAKAHERRHITQEEHLLARLTDLKRFENKHKKAIANFNDLKQQFINKAQEYQEIFDTQNVDAITSMESDIILERDGYAFRINEFYLKEKDPNYTIYEDGQKVTI